MWPSSAAAPVEPRYTSPFRISPPPIPGPSLLRLQQLSCELLHQLVLAEAGRGLTALVLDFLLGVDDSDGHLRSAEIDADGLPHAHPWGSRRWLSGGGMRKY